MTPFTLPDALVEQLQDIAEKEHRSVEDVLQTMIQQYTPKTDAEAEISEEAAEEQPNPLLGLLGLLDEYTNETDLSSTVRETLKKYSHPQYGWTKRDRTD
ncbi:MAG: hypothetical protein K8I30_20170 [Anaerolineae bacterium]|nr:hypothetical protein [Anaerolineae bacterium]